MMRKKILSAILAVCLMLTMTPTWAMAQADSDQSPESNASDGQENYVVAEETVSVVPDAEDLPDNDELFAGYVQQILYGDLLGGISPYAYKKPASSKLSGLDLKLYNKLKEKIQYVAQNGESTVFEFSMNKDLGIKLTWTLTELGLSSFSDGNAVSEALSEKAYNFDSHKIVDALLVDCPYELYWYNKTGNGGGYDYSISSFRYSISGSSLTFSTDPKITFTFRVSQDYATTVTTVDASRITAAQTAAENAAAIVTKHNGKSDYDKLYAYMEEICSLVKYNDDAADDSKITPYGDPWQLVKVFDHESGETGEVVCEGYSKAFQYLCDLTNADDDNGFTGEVDCYIVTGLMGSSGGSATGAGAHMWNIVTIGGGNYLVDVTNCDGNSIGRPDLLFLAGSPGGDKNVFVDADDKTKTYDADYSFAGVGSSRVHYLYDADQTALWGADTLELAGTNYRPAKNLTGTVSISSSTAKLGEKLTASYTGTETVTYQWLRGGSIITGATETDYTLVAADVGKKISVRVSADGYNSKTSAEVGPVAKGDQTGAAVEPNITAYDEKSITVKVESGQEYAISTSAAVPTSGWKTSGSFTGLTAGTTYYIHTRKAETTTLLAGPVTYTTKTTKKVPSAADFNLPASWTDVYTGSTLVPAITAKAGGPTNYTVKYNNSTDTSKVVAAGDYPVTVEVAADDSYIAKTITLGTWKITPKAVTINAADKTVAVGGTVALSVTTDPSELTGATLSYTSSNTAVATVDSNGVVTGKTVGTAEITISLSGSQNYTAQTKKVTVSVTAKKSVTVNFSAATTSGKYTESGYALGSQFNAASVTPPSGVTLSSTVKYQYGGNTYNSLSELTQVVKDVGTYTVTAVYEDTEYFGSANASFEIIKADQAALTITSAAAMQYGETLTLAVNGGTGDGAVTYAITVGSDIAGISGNVLTPVKVGTVTVKATKSGGANYEDATATATITISKMSAPAAPTVTVTYEAATADKFTAIVTAVLSDMPAGVQFEYSADGTNYQDGNRFEVTASTTDTPVTGTFHARAKGTDNVETGAAGVSEVVTFSKLSRTDKPTLAYKLTRSEKDESGHSTVTITITPVSGAEYSFDGGATWKDENKQGGFTDEETVSLQIRYKETNTQTASAAESASVNTAKQPQAAPAAFTLTFTLNADGETYTASAPAVSGAEYSFDGAAWSSNRQLTGVQPGQTVSVSMRMAETEDLLPSDAVSDTQTAPLLPVQAPTARPSGGTFTDKVTVTLSSATPDAQIYYTTDGTAPTADSTLYEAPFTLTRTTTVKAIAVKEGMSDSTVESFTFTKYVAPVSPSKPSSGGSTKPTEPAQTEEDDDTSVTTTKTTVTAKPEVVEENGAAAATVTDDMGQALVDQAVRGGRDTVVIAPEVSKGTSITQVSIPAATVADIGAQTGADLRIETPAADVTIPNSALESLAGNSGSVSVTTASIGGMVELEINAGGQRVEKVDGGVTVSVPVSNCGPGTVAMLVKEDGSTEIVRQSIANPASGAVTVPVNGSVRLTFVDNTKEFSDISANNWAAGAVAFASSHELMNGTGSGKFEPEETMNRSMLAMVLYNLAGNPAAGTAGGFPDVPSSQWYAEAVQWAAENKIVTGYENGNFGPDDPITREQLAVMLYRYAGSPAASAASMNFADAGSISSFAQQAMNWAVANGILNGKGNGILDPQGKATRAEVAQMLMNFVNSMVK